MSGQVWATSSLGGYMSSQKLSDKLRYALYADCRFRQFCDVKDPGQQGMHHGATFTWNVYSEVQTRGTTVAEDTEAPRTNFIITQSTLTMTEAINSIPYTGKLEALSEHDLTTIVETTMMEDCKGVLEALAFTQFNQTLLRVTGTASGGTLYFTSDGTATNTNSGALAKGDIGDIYDAMKERNIPAYKNGDYYCLSHPSTFRTLKDDLQSVQQYTTEGLKNIRMGEVGRFEKTVFVEQTCIPKGGAADATTFNAYTRTAEAWDNAKSSWAFFFGSQTVAEAIAVPEEVRAKIPTDFGRSKGMAWYYLGGFGIVRNGLHNYATIMKWDSAS